MAEKISLIILTISIIGWAWAIRTVNKILAQRDHELSILREVIQEVHRVKNDVDNLK